MTTISIIVPTYNEAENVDLLLRRIFAVESLHDYCLEVVFSDGASDDATCQHVKRWAEKDERVRLVRAEVNEGLSAAVMAGARAAEGEFVVVIDADLSHPPEMIPALVAPLVDGSCDMTIGSRYVYGGDTPEWPFARKLSSRLATIPARFFTDVKDPLAGFIAMRRERLADLNREVSGFKIGLELLATASERLRVKEIPIIFRDRCFGTSKMGLKVMLDYCRQLFVLTGVDWQPAQLGKMLPLFLAFIICDTTLLTMLSEHGSHPASAQMMSILCAGLLTGGILWWQCHSFLKRCSGVRCAEYCVGYLWVLLLASLLRSGLVVVLAGTEKLNTAAILVSAFFALAVLYGGNVCYVFSIGKKRLSRELVERYYGLGVFLYLLLLRLVFLGALPPLAEERSFLASLLAMSGDDTLQAVDGAIMLPGSAGGGVTILRLVAWLLWLASCMCIFSLGRFMHDRSGAFLASLLFAVLPIYFVSGFFFSADSLVIFFWVWALYMLYRGLVNDTGSGWIWAGVAIGFGIQVNVHLAPLLAASIFFLLVNQNDRKRLLGRYPLYGLLATVSTILATFVLWPSYISQDIGEAGWLVTLLTANVESGFLAILLLLSPTGILAGGYVVFCWLLRYCLDEHNPSPRATRTRRFVLTMFFVPLFCFLLPGLFAGGPVALGGVVWLVLLPTMATTIGTWRGVSGSVVARLLQVVWWPTIGVLLLCFGVALHCAVL